MCIYMCIMYDETRSHIHTQTHTGRHRHSSSPSLSSHIPTHTHEQGWIDRTFLPHAAFTLPGPNLPPPSVVGLVPQLQNIKCVVSASMCVPVSLYVSVCLYVCVCLCLCVYVCCRWKTSRCVVCGSLGVSEPVNGRAECLVIKRSVYPRPHTYMYMYTHQQQNNRKVGVVTTYGSERKVVRYVGDPGRRIVSRGAYVQMCACLC